MFKRRIIFILIIFIFIIDSVGFVLADEIESEEPIEESIITSALPEEDVPKIDSRVAVIYDRKSKRVIWGKDENKRVAMASTTKILTATVVLENSKLEDEVTVSAKAGGIGGSRLGLKKNDKITVKDLLYGLMLCSGNDAAVALAEHVGGSVEGFAEKMNNKAEELGLKDSHFVTPHGLDNPEHYTTAYELAILADYAMQNEIFCKIVATKNINVIINGNSKNISNTNELLGYLEGVKGVKTGFTNNAGRCLVTCTNRNDFEIITVVLGADTKKIRTQDSIKLIEYTFKNYKQVDISQIINNKFLEWKKENEEKIQIEKAKENYNLDLILGNLKYTTIPIKNNDTDNIEVKINVNYFYNAPVEANTVFGELNVIFNKEVIDVIKIINKDKIDKKDKKDYFLKILQCFA